MAGFIYVMSNPSFDGRVKIGKSIKDPTLDRVQELNSSTATPEPFSVEYYCYADQFDKIERSVHQSLDALRPNKKREFFTIEVNQAVEHIREVAHGLGGIKFEECFFEKSQITSVKNSKRDQTSADPSEAVDIVDCDPGAIEADLYPKALRAVEYNSTARSYLDLLSKVPGDARQVYLKALDAEPNMSKERLDFLFKDEFVPRYLKPFDHAFANYFFLMCVDHSVGMAEQFQSDFEILHPTVGAQTIYLKLCEKFEVEVDTVRLSGPTYFYEIASMINDLRDLSKCELTSLFGSIGLRYEMHNGAFYIFENSRIIISRKYADDLLLLMKRKDFLQVALNYDQNGIDRKILGPEKKPLNEEVLNKRSPDTVTKNSNKTGLNVGKFLFQSILGFIFLWIFIILFVS